MKKNKLNIIFFLPSPRRYFEWYYKTKVITEYARNIHCKSIRPKNNTRLLEINQSATLSGKKKHLFSLQLGKPSGFNSTPTDIGQVVLTKTQHSWHPDSAASIAFVKRKLIVSLLNINCWVPGPAEVRWSTHDYVGYKELKHNCATKHREKELSTQHSLSLPSSPSSKPVSTETRISLLVFYS